MGTRRIRFSGVTACLVLLTACGPPARQLETWEALGTTATAEVYTRTEHDGRATIEEIRRTIERAATELDPESASGELAAVNRRASDEFYRIRQIDVYACLKLALDYARESRGAYDPTLGVLRKLHDARSGTANPPRPTEIEITLSRVGWEKVTVEPEAMAVQFRAPGLQLDLGPVARGCALDWAARTFARPGSVAGLLRLDGVFQAWRAPPGQEDWSVPIPDPRAPDHELLKIRVANRGLAVLGQRGAAATTVEPQALDPRTGFVTTTDLLAVVTTADSAADAAALGQAVFIAGSLQGSEFFRKTRRTEAVLLVREDGGRPYVLASASLEGRIELSPRLTREAQERIRFLLPPESF